MIYAIKYEGVFGFIKPFTSMRDELINSEKYLYPSTINGIEKKLFNNIQNRIIGHRLNFDSLSLQNETTRSIGLVNNRHKNGIVKRYVLINPKLFLFFYNFNDATMASKKSIFLSRNEDILYPNNKIYKLNENELENIDGFEGVETNENDPEGVFVGFNKYTQKRQYIKLEIYGTPSLYKYV